VPSGESPRGRNPLLRFPTGGFLARIVRFIGAVPIAKMGITYPITADMAADIANTLWERTNTDSL